MKYLKKYNESFITNQYVFCSDVDWMMEIKGCFYSLTDLGFDLEIDSGFDEMQVSLTYEVNHLKFRNQAELIDIHEKLKEVNNYIISTKLLICLQHLDDLEVDWNFLGGACSLDRISLLVKLPKDETKALNRLNGVNLFDFYNVKLDSLFLDEKRDIYWEFSDVFTTSENIRLCLTSGLVPIVDPITKSKKNNNLTTQDYHDSLKELVQRLNKAFDGYLKFSGCFDENSISFISNDATIDGYPLVGIFYE